MALNVSWWMYVLNAFSPFLALIMLAHLKSEQQKETGSNTVSTNAAEPLPPLASAFAGILTQVIMAGFLYAFWLAAHWLIFWLLNKPLHLDAYFYKPAQLAYWFPYLFGLYLVFYSTIIAPQHSAMRIKAVFNTIHYLGFGASFYMVFVTYLKWLIR